MRRLTRVGATAAAVLLALSTTTSIAPTHAAGPPLRYLAGASGTLDPAFIADAGDVQLLLQLYAGLTRLDEAGEPYPSLASGWDISPDGLTYQFTIRSGLTFSDGSSLVAEDIRRSWLRLLDPATGATAPDVLSVVDGADAAPRRRRRRGRGRHQAHRTIGRWSSAFATRRPTSWRSPPRRARSSSRQPPMTAMPGRRPMPSWAAARTCSTGPRGTTSCSVRTPTTSPARPRSTRSAGWAASRATRHRPSPPEPSTWRRCRVGTRPGSSTTLTSVRACMRPSRSP